MNPSLFKLSTLAFAAATMLIGCGGGGGGDDGPQSVALEFASYAGSTPVKCGTAVASAAAA